MPSRDATLIEAGLVLSAELSLPAVLQRIIELAVGITDARYGALGVVGPDGLIIEFRTTGISDGERKAIGALPVGHGILGALIDERRPLRVRDIAEDPRSYGFPPNHPPMRSFLGAPIESHGRVFGNIYLTEKRGADEFDDEDERALVVLAAQAGVAVENARLYEESRQREQWLEAFRDIATEILTGGGSDAALALVARKARELVGADLATISVPAGTGTLQLRVVVGAHADELEGSVFPAEGSISGEVIATTRPIILADAALDERAHQPIIRLGNIGPAIFVPLSARGEAFGTVGVANVHGGRVFGEDDLKLVETIAAQAALALEYARAQEDLQRLAIMDDRERIARELHDGVIQSLFAVGMGLEAAGAMSDDTEVATRIDLAAGEVDRVVRDLRNYIFGLQPGVLADRQLDQALRELARDFEEKTGIVTAVDIDEHVAAELASRAADIVQITREALSNVGRHSGAETCRVSLYGEDDSDVLEVDDDGKGFDTGASRSGSGLTNIRERAASLEGSAVFESSLGEGTAVRVTLPR